MTSRFKMPSPAARRAVEAIALAAGLFLVGFAVGRRLPGSSDALTLVYLGLGANLVVLWHTRGLYLKQKGLADEALQVARDATAEAEAAHELVADLRARIHRRRR